MLRNSLCKAILSQPLSARKPLSPQRGIDFFANQESGSLSPARLRASVPAARAHRCVDIAGCNLKSSPARTSSSRIISSSMVSRISRGDSARITPAARARSEISNSSKASERAFFPPNEYAHGSLAISAQSASESPDGSWTLSNGHGCIFSASVKPGLVFMCRVWILVQQETSRP
jgi:hypothetical protein